MHIYYKTEGEKQKFKTGRRNVCSPLEVDVVVRVGEDELLAAEGGFGVVLLGDVQVTELHPRFSIAHETR